MARIVIALGGNALGNNAAEQERMINDACPALVGLISQGHEIIVTHGNGPQVGAINLAFDTASKQGDKVPPMPLAECTAMSQGYIGYHLQKGILKELRKQKMPWQVASVITQVEVDPNDPSFSHPTKPIGAFYTKEQADILAAADKSLKFVEDSGRGYRQVVASPKPKAIVEQRSILNLLDSEYIVIACGGGGIPVIKNADGDYRGVSAVIDKDFAAALLASSVGADYLFILTAVDRVCINFGTPEQREIKEMRIAEALSFIDKGEFGKGSMLPKVQAAVSFVESGYGKTAVIASLEKAPLAMSGVSGTVIRR